MHHVTVLHDIRFSLSAHFAGFFCSRLAAKRGKIVIGYGLSANEPAREITMDNTRGLRRGCTLFDRPGPSLFRADCEIGLKRQKRLACADQAIKAGFLKPHFVKKHLSLFVVKLANLFFDLRGNDHMAVALLCGHFRHSV